MTTFTKHPNQWLPANFTVTNWEALLPWFEDLKNRHLQNKNDLLQWLLHRSELEQVLEEDMGWRYIRMTCNTADKEAEKEYLYFVSEIEPKAAPYANALNEKMVGCPYLAELDSPDYFTYFRRVKQELELYREENIPLFVEIQTLSQKYGQISGAMTVMLEGKTLTLQQASNYYKNTDRALRQQAFEAINSRRMQDADQLNDLFDELLALRHRVAVNAGFQNFRDYMFASLGRFDYTVADCEAFHRSVELEVLPLVKKLDINRSEKLGLKPYRPWDTEVDTEGRPALQPFTNGDELLQKTLTCFRTLDPWFAQCIEAMIQMGHFDVESRIGKAPGGYNYPLPATGVPFIFMNAAGNTRDVETMVHEAGHAFHSILTRNLQLNTQKNFPSEVAELASMSMELISAEAQACFYTNTADHQRAKQEHLEGIVRVLPWIATVDMFQHWLYTNPGHTQSQRAEAWLTISGRFSTHITDWQGYEQYRPNAWHKQLHIFEVPFYYIEYGFAQLGALGVWKNYLNEPVKALEQYKAALSMGYLRGIPDIYRTAGSLFDFSAANIRSLMQLVRLHLA